MPPRAILVCSDRGGTGRDDAAAAVAAAAARLAGAVVLVSAAREFAGRYLGIPAVEVAVLRDGGTPQDTLVGAVAAARRCEPAPAVHLVVASLPLDQGRPAPVAATLAAVFDGCVSFTSAPSPGDVVWCERVVGQGGLFMPGRTLRVLLDYDPDRTSDAVAAGEVHADLVLDPRRLHGTVDSALLGLARWVLGR